MFGDDLLVAPVTAAAGDDGFAKQDAWLPKGDWFDVARGRMLRGGQTVSARYRLDDVPVFARAGAIVPTNSDPTRSVANDDGARTLVVYPGKNQQAELYEDAGDDEGYRGGAFARTRLSTEWSRHAVRLRIAAREGQYSGMPSTRHWSVSFVASAMPSRVIVDGQPLQRVGGDVELKPGTWRLEGRTLSLQLALPEHDFASAQVVDVTWPNDAPDVDGLAGEMRDVREAVEWLKSHWTEFGGIPDDLSAAAQADRLIDYHPERFAQEVAAFRARVRQMDSSLEKGGVPAEMRRQFGARML
jgi:hypothetical protein